MCSCGAPIVRVGRDGWLGWLAGSYVIPVGGGYSTEAQTNRTYPPRYACLFGLRRVDQGLGGALTCILYKLLDI